MNIKIESDFKFNKGNKLPLLLVGPLNHIVWIAIKDEDGSVNSTFVNKKTNKNISYNYKNETEAYIVRDELLKSHWSYGFLPTLSFGQGDNKTEINLT